MKQDLLEKENLEISEPEIAEVKLPDGWEWKKLGYIAKFIDYRGKTPLKTKNGLPLITAKNIRMGYISEDLVFCYLKIPRQR